MKLRKPPAVFHDLASNPEKKVKELIKLYNMRITRNMVMDLMNWMINQKRCNYYRER